MTPASLPLSALQPLSPNRVEALRWYLAGEHAGDLGLRSSIGGQIQQLRLGARIQPTQRFDFEPTPAQRVAAAWANDIATRLGEIAWRHQRVLADAFGPTPEGSRVPGYFDEALGVDLGPVLVRLAVVRQAHASSRSVWPLRNWLGRLAWRVDRKVGGTQAQDRRRFEEFMRLGREALLLASAAYGRARGTGRPMPMPPPWRRRDDDDDEA